MNFLDIKAGDSIEVGAIIAWREWRYRYRPLRLLSLSFSLEWSPDHPQESDPDTRHSGVFALKLRSERWAWSQIQSAGPQDGYVIGRVALWGVVWEHVLGYRAQYAKPISFDEARGENAEVVLERLRSLFGMVH